MICDRCYFNNVCKIYEIGVDYRHKGYVFLEYYWLRDNFNLEQLQRVQFIKHRSLERCPSARVLELSLSDYDALWTVINHNRNTSTEATLAQKHR